jgi:hypothetical protein
MLISSAHVNIVLASENEPDADALTVEIIPTDDALIRRDKLDQNFGDMANMSADIREGSRRYGIIRFDASDIKSVVDTSSKIYMKYCAVKQVYTNRVRLYPLYGNHKNFDENKITWSIASSMMENEVSLADWLGDEFDVPVAEEGALVNYVDVTEYVKSQKDYVYAFKTWAKEGNDNYASIKSKESKGFEPQLIFYTEVNYILDKAAEEIISSIPASSLTEDFYLPSVWDNSELLKDVCEVNWESSDESVIAVSKTDGGYFADVCERSEAEDKTAHLTMRLNYRGVSYEESIDVRVIRTGIVPIMGDTYINGGSYAEKNHGTEKSIFCASTGIDELNTEAYLSFRGLTSEEKSGAHRIILRLFPNNGVTVQKGTVYVSSADDFYGDIEEIDGNTTLDCNFGGENSVQFNCENAVDINVTDICGNGEQLLFKLRSDGDGVEFFSSNSQKPAQLIILNEDRSRLHDAFGQIKNEYFSEKDSITGDISLPYEADGAKIQWSSSDMDISDGCAAVIRPGYLEGDKRALISAHINGNGSEEDFELLLNIRQNEPGGVNGHRKLSDPMKLSDEEFFGVWDDDIGSFENTPILQYDTISGLENVEYYAKRGNYAAAKEELLIYYRGRNADLKYDVTPSYGYSLSTQIASEHIIGNQSAVAVFSADSALKQIEIEIPAGGGLSPSYMLFDRSKDGSTGVFYSRQSQYAPYMQVVTNRGVQILECTFDTYFEGGSNSGNINGHDELLYVHEEGNPFNDNVKRTFINFDTSKLRGDEQIKSASIILYGRKLGGKSDKMNLIVYKSLLTPYMNEKDACWNDVTPGTFNFRDCIYNWEAPYGSEAEWKNSMARLESNNALVSSYLGTGNGDYAAAALENMIDIYTGQNVGYPRVLDTAWRTPALLATIFGLIDSEYMTPEVFCALIKYSYEMLVYLDTATLPSVVNQVCAADVGHARLIVYFPEIHDASYYERSRARLDATITTKLTHGDGAYKEATTGYIHGVIEEVIEVIEMYEKIGYTDLDKYKKSAHNLASFSANFHFPNGERIPYGDAGRTTDFDLIHKFGDFFDDNMIRWQSHQTNVDEPDEYKSIIFPIKKAVIMRDGWDEDALLGHITAETGHSHGHPDDLHLDIYAYGRPLLIDAGNGGGYNPILPAATVRTETYAHNTIEINNEPQGYDIGENGMELITNNSFDRVSGFAETYEGFRHKRRIFFLHGGFWIVSDLVIPEDKEAENVYRQNWHPDNNANMETDAVSGAVRTHFAGTANLQILQADMENTALEISQSYIKDKNLENRLEDYAAYEKKAAGDVSFNTLLFPMKSGQNTEVDFSSIEVDGQKTDKASAINLSYDGKNAVYYISNEEEFGEHEFGGFSYNGETAYAEKNADGKLSYAAMVNGSELKNADGSAVIASNLPVKDIAVRRVGKKLTVDTSEKLMSDVRINMNEKIDAVVVNGVQRSFETEGNTVVLKADKILFPVEVSGSRMSYTLTEDYKTSLAIKRNGTVKDVTVAIPKGTVISGSLGWDGEISFAVKESGDGLSIIFNCDYGLTFDKPITISVPFYSSEGGYYMSGGRHSFGADVRASDGGSGCTITSIRGAEYVLPKLKGALTASGNGGGGGGGASAPSVIQTPAPTILPEPDTSPAPAATPEPTAHPAASAFSDIENHWAKEYILKLKEKGIVGGYEDGTYKPDNPLTRAELVKLLVCAFGWNTEYNGGFTDVSVEDWFSGYVGAAKEHGLAAGYDDGSFRPYNIVTREEAAKLFTVAYEKISGERKTGSDLSVYTDSAEISDWAKEYISRAVEYGLISGTGGGKIEPKAEFTRAMAAAVIYRITVK